MATKTPPKMTDFADLVSAEERLADLEAEVRQVDRVICSVEERMAAREDIRARRTERARALTSDGPGVALDDGEIRNELAEAYERRSLLRDAVELQREIVERRRCEASKEICAAIRPQYTDIARDVVSTAQALQAALQREQEFREALMAQNVSFSSAIPPIAFPQAHVFLADGAHCQLNYWLRVVESEHPEAFTR